MRREMGGEPIERRLHIVLIGEARAGEAEALEQRQALTRIGEKPVHIDALHPPVRRHRAVAAAIGEAQLSPLTGLSDLSEVSTVSTSIRPRPSTSPGGPSMPSGSWIRIPNIW